MYPVTSSGKRMAIRPASSGGETISSFQRYVHVEQNNMLRRYDDGHIGDYLEWYWSNQENLSLFVSSPDVVSGEIAEVRLGASTTSPYADLTVNGAAASLTSGSTVACTFQTQALVDGSNELNLRLYPPTYAPAYLNYVEVTYVSDNAPTTDRLDLTLGSYEGSFTVEVIHDFTATPLILDVTDPANPMIVSAAGTSGGIVTFNADMVSSNFSRFYLTPGGSAFTPLSIEFAEPVDLRDLSEQVDLFVVAPDVFVSALNDYVQYRESTGYSLKLVSVEDIMDNFAFGLYDPIAIRDFLKFAYENYPSPVPSAVLFVGDGTYDFMDYLSTHVPNYVPPCLLSIDQSASDDNYVYFGNYGILDSDTSYSLDDKGFDMITSRWPVKSVSELLAVVDKIRRYESPSHFGIWRNNITLVADDEYSGGSTLETIHTVQAEELADYHVPGQFNCDKIYLWEYPFVGNRKPEVNDAIVKAINDGTLIINYIGHGNPDVWSHEAVFTRNDDLPRLSNRERLPLVFAASCAIGFFDDPEREGMAEDFLAFSGGGAIGVISATRLVYSTANADFNQMVYDVLLEDESLSICEAMYTAKLIRQYSGGTPTPITNDRKYLFFGGPFVPLAVPRLDVEFSSVPDSLTALGVTEVSGRVIDESQATYSRDGVLYVNVYDSQREKVYRLVNSSGVVTQTIEYNVTGPTIYRGSATISQGSFDFSFLPPLDIGYGGEGAKISVYAQFDDIDAAGIADSIAVSDSIASFADSTGPVVEVGFVGRHDFASGDIINPDEQMQITISDSSGVNLTGALGHGITLEIDYRSENMINLTSLFQANQDDYTTGSLTYALEELQAGSHHFKVKAWDNANNSTNYEFDAQVYASENLAIRDLLNYPNPMKESTRFSFYLTQPVEKFSIEVFTLSGRRIKSFQRYSLAPGYYDDIEWYGRDSDGGRVATEVYIYKATAHPANGGEKVESYGKVIVVN